MMRKHQYVEYLVNTPINYTCTNLAEHLDDVSHDSISDYLRHERLTARHLWDLVCQRIDNRTDTYLLVDESVQDKRYSHKIELVKQQYSGAVHGLVRGMGVVNLLHSTGLHGDFPPIDHRMYAPDMDGKTKNQHFQEMLVRAIADKHIQAHTVLFDSWYASAENLKLIHRLGRRFFTTLKANRMVSLSQETGYVHLDTIEWTEERLTQGLIVRLKEVPFLVRLFKMVATNGDIDWVITNDLEETMTTHVAQDANDVRWKIEEFHRGSETTDR